MPRLTGKTVAILATDGFEQSELDRPLDALRAQGATVHVVAPHGERIKGWSGSGWGHSVPVDRLLANAGESDYDALVLPAAQVWPFDMTLPWPQEIAGHAMDTYHRWMEVVVPVSLIGLPCLALPAGFGAAGLPAGVQMFTRRGSDAALLALGAAYHAATGWPQERPAM